MSNSIHDLRYSPHVVILGAGASMAAIPHGDLNGKKTSVMSGFLKKLGMSDIIRSLDLHTTSNNLEDIYSELAERSEYAHIVKDMETRIYDYFASLEIPNEPTVYDYLLLSLTSKDLVATFNWDPLLLQAYQRVHRITDNLPNFAFLHGNVAYGYCHGSHDKFVRGLCGVSCDICGKQLEPSKLLYPVAKKDYISDEDIKFNWELTQHYLKRAFMVTIFGYSAPKSDQEAIELLHTAWGNKAERNFEEISIIDIVDEDKLIDTWDDFVYSHHYKVSNSFFDSYLGKFPRRSTEATFDMLFMNVWQDGSHGFKQGMSFNDLADYLSPLLSDEQVKNSKNLTNPYAAKFSW